MRRCTQQCFMLILVLLCSMSSVHADAILRLDEPMPQKQPTAYRLQVLDDGFEYEGRWYRSLSNIANEITGTRWNGFAFFGVTRETGVPPETRRNQKKNGGNGNGAMHGAVH